jgi:sRNA-binding regulator protein Hfq
MKLLIPAVAACATAQAKDTPMFEQILQSCLNEKKSVTIFLNGQTIGGGVVKLTSDLVELKNREYSRIVIRLDSIIGLAFL